MYYSTLCLFLSTVLVKSQETTTILTYNAKADENFWELDNGEFYDQRKPKILNYGNTKRNFLNIIGPNIIDIDNITLIAELIPQQTQVLLLVHDGDTDQINRDNFIRALINSSISKHNLWFMKFNGSDVSTLHHIDKELQILQNDTKSSLGINNYNDKTAGAVFFSMLKGISLLKGNSVIVLFANGRIEDEDVAKLAYKELSRKNIKVFLVWNDDFPSKNRYESLIAEIVTRTGGLVFAKIKSQKYYTIEDDKENTTVSLIVNKMNLIDQNMIHFPIDSGTFWLHISVPKQFLNCSLEAPGFNINLNSIKNMTKIMRSYIQIEESGDNKIFHISEPRTGTWMLNIRGTPNRRYNVQISVQNELFVNTDIVKQNEDKQQTNKKINIQMKFHGSYKRIDKVSLVNENGDEFNDVEFITLNNDHTKINASDTDNMFNIDVNKMPNNDTFYVKTTGTDSNGKPFVRLSYVPMDFHNRKLQPLTIEVGEGSELYAIPNQSPNIYFKVRNNRMHHVYLRFHCKSNKRILRSMNVYRTTLRPQQTITVIVNMLIIPEAGTRFRDEIRFTADGYFGMEKIAYLTVEHSLPIDNVKPNIWHSFSKSCSVLNNCQEEDWSVDVTAQDTQTGLRELTSFPDGLYFNNEYISGSKEPITGHYTGSCCQSKLQIIAYDVMNNKKYYDIDAYRAPLGAGEIAAIVLGVLIILAIIVGLIIWCVCKKAANGSYDLPIYRGPTRRCD